MKRTQKQFEKEVYELTGNEYTFNENYINCHTKISVTHNCEKCNNYTYKVTPNKFLKQNSRCPECYGTKKKTTQSFSKEVNTMTNGEYELKSEYINNRTKVKIFHKKCGKIYEVTPTKFQQGRRCICESKFSPVKHTKKELQDLLGDDFIIIGEYINTNTPIEIFHKKCRNYSSPTPNNIFNKNVRCRFCNESKGEKRIKEYLDSKNISYEREKKFKELNNLRFDFYINYNNKEFLLEFDGEQHFKEIEFFGGKDYLLKIKENDKIKNLFCEENNLKLLRISYKEIDNIEKIIDNYLKTFND